MTVDHHGARPSEASRGRRAQGQRQLLLRQDGADDHRDLARLRHLFQTPQHHPAVLFGHHDVEDHQVRRPRAERGLLTRSDRQRILDGILFTPDLVEAATGAEVVLLLTEWREYREIDPAAFAHAIAVRASALNEDVAAAWDRWDAIPPAGRKMILEQLRYLTRVLPLLERESP